MTGFKGLWHGTMLTFWVAVFYHGIQWDEYAGGGRVCWVESRWVGIT